MKWLAKTEGGGNNNQLELLKQVFNESSLVFNNVVIGRLGRALASTSKRNII